MLKKSYRFPAGSYYIGDVNEALPDDAQRAIWGTQSYYSFVNEIYKSARGDVLVIDVTPCYNVTIHDGDGIEYRLNDGCLGILPFDLVKDNVNVTGDGYRGNS